MSVFIVYTTMYWEARYYLVKDPRQEDLDVLQRYHEVPEMFCKDDSVTYQEALDDARCLVTSWEKYRVGRRDNPPVLTTIDEVHFYGRTSGWWRKQ